MFDIDGTLLSTGGAGGAAWARAFEDIYGTSANIADHTEAGMPDHEVGRLTFLGVIGREPEERELARVMTRYLSHLSRTVAESPGYRLMPEIPQLLERLADSGYLLGLTTGNVEAAAHVKLGRGDLNRFFCFGGYGSDSKDRGELTLRAIERAGALIGRTLDPSTVLVVGDTPHDVEAAHYAKAVAVAVATGHFSREELAETGADHVLGSFQEAFPLEISS
ncbi:MAG: HAD family hydrolase [Gaiellales bacterium]